VGTVRVGVVGHPISHSLSPAIHTAAIRHLGLDATYEAFDVDPSDFEAFVRDAREGGMRGFNVTVPHKSAAFEIATVRSPEASATGAANVLLFDEELEAYNTDVAGVRLALADLGVKALSKGGARALVLGAGGAGRAAVYALRSQGAEVLVANRTRAKAEDLGVEVVDLADAPTAAAGVDVLVHATTVGLADETSPLPFEALEAAASGRLVAVLDAVYRPGETELVRLARRAGIRAEDGLAMLIHQAAEAFSLFFGRPAPLAEMRAEGSRVAHRPERTS
jgi:shikimate dehydrogenase